MKRIERNDMFTQARATQLDNLEKHVNQLQESVLKQNGIQGPPGPMGPSGQQGVPGAGPFHFQGIFRNLNHPDMVMDRTNTAPVNSKNSRVFLNQPNQSTNQSWTLQQGGQMTNQWGQCLTASKNETNQYDVYMSDCDSNNSISQNWTYDRFGRLQWKGSENSCLNASEQKPPEGITSPLSNGFVIEPTNVKTYFMVSIDSCGDSSLTPEQKRPLKFASKQWSFY